MSADQQWYAGRRLTSGTTQSEFLAGLNDQPWAGDALCAQTDPEAFFPDKGGSTREAKAVCKACDVRSDCLAYAVDRQERYGIWGGLSERERRRLKAAPDAPPRPCARVGCAAMIPATTATTKRYHDADCRRTANEDKIIAALDHQPILDAYLIHGATLGSIASSRGLQHNVVARILDAHGIDHNRTITRARRQAARAREAS